MKAVGRLCSSHAMSKDLRSVGTRPPLSSCSECIPGQLFGRQISNVISTTFNFFLSIQPVIPLLGILPKETSEDTCHDL